MMCDVINELRDICVIDEVCAHDGGDEKQIKGEIEKHSWEVEDKGGCNEKDRGDNEEETHVEEYVELMAYGDVDAECSTASSTQ